ncbi:MAG: class I SAM-dependent methyltransferase [Thauera sp.]
MSDGFYRAFEERHRGSRELIKGRLAAYLPFVESLLEVFPVAATIDLGCGRGEWLELLAESGFKPVGVDLDKGMLEACLERGLQVEQGDALAYLSALPDESQVVVSAFHVVEHITFDHLRTLVAEALRVLKPGGLLIMETPNPENIVVATRNFYLDPTHQRPIPPMLLAFAAEYAGFARVKTLRLQESKELVNKDDVSLHDVFAGASPDYAVVAQKHATDDVLALTSDVFSIDYGLSLDNLLSRWDGRFERLETKAEQAEARATQAETKAQQAEQQAEARATQAEVREGEAREQAHRSLEVAQRAQTLAQQAEARAQQVEAETRMAQAEARAQQAEAETRMAQAEARAQQAEAKAEQALMQLGAVYASTSWRITAPLRWMKSSLGLPSSKVLRPKLKLLLQHAALYIRRRPKLKRTVLSILEYFPGIRARLFRVVSPMAQQVQAIRYQLQHEEPDLASLTPRARQIHADLKSALARQHKGGN